MFFHFSSDLSNILLRMQWRQENEITHQRVTMLKFNVCSSEYYVQMKMGRDWEWDIFKWHSVTLSADEGTLVVGKMLFTLLEYYFLCFDDRCLNANEWNSTDVGLARSDINYEFFTFKHNSNVNIDFNVTFQHSHLIVNFEFLIFGLC